jgi:predicted O-linked N-acetylglucosamine transferase (SPINDLY family)
MNVDPLSKATAIFKAGKAAEAVAILDAHLDKRPMDAGATHLKGIALHALGRAEEAIDALRRAIAIDGGNATYHGNLARALAASSQYEDAEKEFRTALRLRPASGSDLAGLANLLLVLGRLEEASETCGRAVMIEPENWLARLNAGVIAFARGDVPLAEEHLSAAISGHPRSDDALANLGYVKLARAERTDALALFDRALALAPGHAHAAVGRGRALFELGKTGEAIDTFARAEAASPADGEASFQLGAAAARLGDVGTARAAIDRAVKRAPGLLKYRWHSSLLLPRIYRSVEQIEDCRRAWTDRVEALAADLRLDTPARVRDAVEAITSTTNFDLNYQGRDDRPLQELYGRLLHRIAAARFPRLAEPPATRPSRTRPRIGFVSAFLHMHSIYKTHGAWVTWLGDGFETCVYYLGNVRDEAIAEVRQASDRFVEVSTAEGLVEALARDQLDAVVYPDIGMTSRVQLAAALWLAPVQCNGLGHPVTSGLPTITHALSSELMEPADGERHYCERLVRLPHTAACYRSSLLSAALAGSSAARSRDGPSIGSGPGRVRYLCAQNLQKYLPQHDRVFVEIAAEVPGAEFHFVADIHDFATRLMRERLAGAFAGRGLDADSFCVFHPRLDRSSYLELNLACDVFLDSLLWSGNNTAHEAIACGLPIITLPGPLMRGRHASALLDRMGIGETIATTPDAYVALAVRAAHDMGWRRHLRAEIQRHRPVLFDDRAPVDALAEFLRREHLR